jgi:hypothetical protein
MTAGIGYALKNLQLPANNGWYWMHSGIQQNDLVKTMKTEYNGWYWMHSGIQICTLHGVKSGTQAKLRPLALQDI